MTSRKKLLDMLRAYDGLVYLAASRPSTCKTVRAAANGAACQDECIECPLRTCHDAREWLESEVSDDEKK